MEYLGSVLNMITSTNTDVKHKYIGAIWYCVVKLPNNHVGCGMHFTQRNHHDNQEKWDVIYKLSTHKPIKITKQHDKHEKKINNIISYINDKYNPNNDDNIYTIPVALQYSYKYETLGFFDIILQTKTSFTKLAFDGVEFALYYQQSRDQLWTGQNYKEFFNDAINGELDINKITTKQNIDWNLICSPSHDSIGPTNSCVVKN